MKTSTTFSMASISEAPMPTYKQGVRSWVTHLARTHPVVASPQLVHFGILIPPDNRLPGLRCFEIFLCKNITDVRFELGQHCAATGALRIDILALVLLPVAIAVA